MSHYCPTIVIAIPALACMASCLHCQFAPLCSVVIVIVWWLSWLSLLWLLLCDYGSHCCHCSEVVVTTTVVGHCQGERAEWEARAARSKRERARLGRRRGLEMAEKGQRRDGQMVRLGRGRAEMVRVRREGEGKERNMIIRGMMPSSFRREARVAVGQQEWESRSGSGGRRGGQMETATINFGGSPRNQNFVLCNWKKLSNWTVSQYTTQTLINSLTHDIYIASMTQRCSLQKIYKSHCLLISLSMGNVLSLHH